MLSFVRTREEDLRRRCKAVCAARDCSVCRSSRDAVLGWGSRAVVGADGV